MNYYNPVIFIAEQEYTGSFQTFLAENRPFLSDAAVRKLSTELSQTGRSTLDAGSGVVFNFKVVEAK